MVLAEQFLFFQVGDKSKKIGELEKKIKETDDKCKRMEKQLLLKKDRVNKLEKEVSIHHSDFKPLII